ncbi:hypothetical protein Vadar_003603 [Vaccinium darrowii]|uniref:Uncharacterized protein n=1 Tax=Vaccinium darrowii TaxID=229202 RepID=A0ACB7Y551_9ERIC|nr:hypothetical protein Vadar_003603 [Vaccinium darrowii]
MWSKKKGLEEICVALIYCDKDVESGRELRLDYKLVSRALTSKETALVKHTKCSKNIESPINDAGEAEKEKEPLEYFDQKLAEAEHENGNRCFKEIMYLEAVRHYTKALWRNPKDPRVYSFRAACYLKLSSMTEALNDAEKSIELDPTFAKGYSSKGAVLVFMNAYDKALETYQEGLKHDPCNQELIDGLRRRVEQIVNFCNRFQKVILVLLDLKNRFLENIDNERCNLMRIVTNGEPKLVIQARFKGFRVGSRYVATGFIISKRGYFATNVHEIFEKCVTTRGSTKFLQAEVFVTQIGKQKVRLPARVLISDSGVGQAIFAQSNPASYPNTSRLGAEADVGFPLDYFSAEDIEKVFLSSRFVPRDFKFILLDLNAACGFSRGSSFDVKGKVMTNNQSTSSGDFRYFNLAVPVKHLWRLILLHIKTGALVT